LELRRFFYADDKKSAPPVLAVPTTALEGRKKIEEEKIMNLIYNVKDRPKFGQVLVFAF